MESSGRTQGHLPADAYTTDEWYRREQEQLFGSVWQFGGFVEDVAEAGDFVTVQAGPHPLFVVRNPDGSLRAFHNICRHRGTQLLRTIGKSKKSIICPYHHWTYSLDGDLKNIPSRKEEFAETDMSQLCLHKASVETWMGMLSFILKQTHLRFRSGLTALQNGLDRTSRRNLLNTLTGERERRSTQTGRLSSRITSTGTTCRICIPTRCRCTTIESRNPASWGRTMCFTSRYLTVTLTGWNSNRRCLSLITERPSNWGPTCQCCSRTLGYRPRKTHGRHSTLCQLLLTKPLWRREPGSCPCLTGNSSNRACRHGGTGKGNRGPSSIAARTIHCHPATSWLKMSTLANSNIRQCTHRSLLSAQRQRRWNVRF